MYKSTPPMGYNTWNTFGTNISDALIRETADAMVQTGLKDAGYEYLVIDDGWSEHLRDPKTDEIVPSKEKFPNGMKAVADYVHGKGLKFGMYSCVGVRTCANYPGSYQHEFLDAKTFAKIGVDYLKYDYCYKPGFEKGERLYRKMGTALRTVDRDILFSLCCWGHDGVEKWARAVGGDMYRSTGDIVDNFKSFSDIVRSQEDKFCYNGPGCYNDMDMLTVGMSGNGHVGGNLGFSGCTAEEYKTQFSLWCIFGAPLMLGCDVRNMSEETRTLITNKDLIAINQDRECRGIFSMPCSPGFYNNKDCLKKAYFRHLSGSRGVLGVFNFSEDTFRPSILLGEEFGLDAGCGCKMKLEEIFTGEKIGPVCDFLETATLKPHECSVYYVDFVRD